MASTCTSIKPMRKFESIVAPSAIQAATSNKPQAMSSPDTQQIVSYRHILARFFAQSDGRQIISHQIESFNQFMEHDIPEIIHMVNPIVVRGSPETPLAGPRSALASATGLSTSAANALIGGAAAAPHAAAPTVNHEFEISINFGKVTLRKPTNFENNGAVHPMLPNDARLRNLTYAAPLNVDVHVQITAIDNTRGGVRETRTRVFPNVHLGKIPVMVGSKYCLLRDQPSIHPSQLGECEHDMGGYFIIQGGERAVISQERMSENRPFVFRNGRNSAKDVEVVEIKCIGPDNDQVPKSNAVKMVYHPKNPTIKLLRATVPRIKSDIPLFVLFKALGVTADKDIWELILGPDGDPVFDAVMSESMMEASTIHTQEAALAWLAQFINSWSVRNQKQISIADILAEELFPQIGGADKTYEKACFLAHMTRKMLWVNAKRLPADDRDAYPNKRVDIPGFLMADLFRKTVTARMVKDIRASLSKEIHNGSWRANGNYEEIVNINNINKIIKSTILDVNLKSSMATGNFGSTKIGGPAKIGVSQVLNRLNYLASISHLRRISTPIEKTGKLIAPRKLHNSQWGYICPAETPEGHSVGVVKNMASTAFVSIYSEGGVVADYLGRLGTLRPLQGTSVADLHQDVRVFLNGAWIGTLAVDAAIGTVAALKAAKRSGVIHIHTGIIWKPVYKELWITTEAGRMLRPLFVADSLREIAADGTGRLRAEVDGITDWNTLLLWRSPGGHGLIEYMDAGETEGAYIAMNMADLFKAGADYTHAEIHPSISLGTLASNIPFPDHNQSPRNAYQASMGKQAMGVYSLNYRERFDTMAHVLSYVEKPFVSPFMSRFYKAQELPTGQNIIVAIMTYSGYNQEDSNMFNRASLERGRFRSIFYRTYKDEERKNQSSGEEERFCRPEPELTRQLKSSNYDKLGADGFVPENTYVDSDDILIGKVVPLRVATGAVLPAGAKRFRDVSRTPRNNEVGYVDKIYKSRNGEGYSFAKIRMRQDRIPEIGDKFCLTGDHEVLTRDQGWISIRNVRIGQIIAAGGGAAVSWEIVKDTPVFDLADKDVLHNFVNEDGAEQIVTAEHRMYCLLENDSEYRMIRAEYIARYIESGHVVHMMNADGKPVRVIGYRKLRVGNTTYSGDKVYCVTVPSGVFLVRRAGSDAAVWTGNSSRHGQKGTLGMILNPEDMPQTAGGLVPDMIINPHCIPSRMTIAQLMETLLGKLCCQMGTLGDGTPFGEVTVENMARIMRDQYGLEPYGNEILYNGHTGRMMETAIFIGPCYYQRLRHCSADKMHSRASGPLVMLTRQPAEGRAREGGLRFGEMERDCVAAHGIAEFTKERFMECSDAFPCNVCRDCGLLAITNPATGVWLCRGCGNTTNFSNVQIPYASKLLIQELETMCISSRILTQGKLLRKPMLTDGAPGGAFAAGGAVPTLKGFAPKVAGGGAGGP